MKQTPGEAELLEHIYEWSAGLHGLSGTFGEVVVGPGDDCAVIREPGGGLLLIGVDQLVEGRHFDPETPIDLAARKAVARAVSDIAAMGGRPCWALAAGVLSHGFDRSDALFDAMAAWAGHWGCPLIGGDIAFGPGPLTLSVTVAGRMNPGTPPLLRSGARPGDELWLTGQIGGSMASGWHLLFEPRLDAGVAAADSGQVRAAIDISDGLGRDADRVGRASGVRLEIDATKLPVSHHSRGWHDACREGEDYELL
ncbi:MAG TPA: thiamine-monophosphate kinase, partial [Phycisphaerales bacterium]|nr:thiamine-monophosphate kinase [Phycisphaerales bacterium]